MSSLVNTTCFYFSMHLGFKNTVIASTPSVFFQHAFHLFSCSLPTTINQPHNLLHCTCFSLNCLPHAIVVIYFLSVDSLHGTVRSITSFSNLHRIDRAFPRLENELPPCQPTSAQFRILARAENEW